MYRRVVGPENSKRDAARAGFGIAAGGMYSQQELLRLRNILASLALESMTNGGELDKRASPPYLYSDEDLRSYRNP